MNGHIVGVDEAGRGPLAGPVLAAAVILNPNYPINGLADSKKLAEKQREKLYREIMAHCIVGIGHASVTEIDQMNILQATLLAMRRAVSQLTVVPAEIWVDGNQDPQFSYPTRLIIGGDAMIPAISAASIIAKVTRDRLMRDLDEQHPGYGLAQHKGYGTTQHITALKKLGASACHRKTFQPVKSVVGNQESGICKSAKVMS